MVGRCVGLGDYLGLLLIRWNVIVVFNVVGTVLLVWLENALTYSTVVTLHITRPHFISSSSGAGSWMMLQWVCP